MDKPVKPNLAQTKRASKPITYTTREHPSGHVTVFEPIPIWKGGEPENFMDEVRDLLDSPAGKDYWVVVADSMSMLAEKVIEKAAQDTSSTKQKQRTWAGFTPRDKAQYMYAQGVLSRAIIDMSEIPINSVFLGLVGTLTEDVIVVGDNGNKERASRVVGYGFKTSGKAQIKALSPVFSPGLVHVVAEQVGLGNKARIEHRAYLRKHGNPPFEAKWRIAEAPDFMNIEGLEGCEAFWDEVEKIRGKWNLGIYGGSGDGKSTLTLTVLRRMIERKDGKMAYLAIDPKSGDLPTVWPGVLS